MATDRITRDDIESKARDLMGGARAQVDEAKPTLLATAGGVAVLVLGLVYLWGRRRGTKRSAVVEIRRL